MHPTEPNDELVRRALQLLDRGILPRQVERELRDLGASQAAAKRAIHVAQAELRYG